MLAPSEPSPPGSQIATADREDREDREADEDGCRADPVHARMVAVTTITARGDLSGAGSP
jgi:hypothetical protein